MCSGSTVTPVIGRGVIGTLIALTIPTSVRTLLVLVACHTSGCIKTTNIRHKDNLSMPGEPGIKGALPVGKKRIPSTAPVPDRSSRHRFCGLRRRHDPERFCRKNSGVTITRIPSQGSTTRFRLPMGAGKDSEGARNGYVACCQAGIFCARVREKV